MKKLLTIAVALLILVSFAGCAKKGGSIKEITVGAKDYTEEYILGNLYSIMLRENGFKVTENSEAAVQLSEKVF